MSRRLLVRLGPSADTCQRQFAAQEQQKQQSDAGDGEWLLIHKHDFHSRAKSALTPTAEEVKGRREKSMPLKCTRQSVFTAGDLNNSLCPPSRQSVSLQGDATVFEAPKHH